MFKNCHKNIPYIWLNIKSKWLANVSQIRKQHSYDLRIYDCSRIHPMHDSWTRRQCPKTYGIPEWLTGHTGLKKWCTESMHGLSDTPWMLSALKTKHMVGYCILWFPWRAKIETQEIGILDLIASIVHHSPFLFQQFQSYFFFYHNFIFLQGKTRLCFAINIPCKGYFVPRPHRWHNIPYWLKRSNSMSPTHEFLIILIWIKQAVNFLFVCSLWSKVQGQGVNINTTMLQCSKKVKWLICVWQKLILCSIFCMI
jgi:hypothetical protein